MSKKERSRGEQIEFEQQVKTEVLLEQVRRRFSSREVEDSSDDQHTHLNDGIGLNTSPESTWTGRTSPEPCDNNQNSTSSTHIVFDSIKKPLPKKLAPMATGKTTSDQRLEKILDTIRSSGVYVTKYSTKTKNKVSTKVLLKLDCSGHLYFDSFFRRTKYNLNFLDDVTYKTSTLLSMTRSLKSDSNIDDDNRSDCESETPTINLNQSANRKFGFSTGNDDRMSVYSDRIDSPISDGGCADTNNDAPDCLALWMMDKDKPLRIALFDRKDEGEIDDFFFAFDYLRQKLMRVPTFLTDYLQSAKE